MKTKVLEFPRSKKKPEVIEADINKILSKYNLFYAHQMENPDSGKVIITLILKEYDKDAKTKIQVKAFRKNKTREIESESNKFMSKKGTKVKFFSQSFSSNTVTALIYHEVVKKIRTKKDDKSEEETSSTDTDKNPQDNK